jgi:glycosyltransferase involved in cell wall biosynthesis
LVASELDALLLLLFPNRERRIFSTGLFGVNYKKNKFYKEANIVHLHWVNGLVRSSSIERIRQPVVWSLRDMWPVTGGCHYSLDCEKYKTGCGNCPQLNGYLGVDPTARLVASKTKKFKNVNPVGISEWVTKEANSSVIFGPDRARTINNNVNCSRFFPVEAFSAREVLGISTNKKVLLIGSTNIRDFYKGASKFYDSLKALDKDKYYLCVFGKPDMKALKSTGFEFNAFGFLHDDISLRLAYSAADVFVAPSIQEAFGKTLVESMACKTPVVCFDATGPASIVDHKVDGYKAKPFDPDDLAAGIEWVVDNPNYEEVAECARNSALKKFDSTVIADQYIELYKGLLLKDQK